MINPMDVVLGGPPGLASTTAAPGKHPGHGFEESLRAAQAAVGHTLGRDGREGITLGAFVGSDMSLFSSTIDLSADWRSQLPPEGRAFADDIEAAAHEAGIDPALLAAVVWAESEFVPDAVSSAGALGLTQLMPATAEILGVDPLDPAANLRGGAQFLADMIARYDGDLVMALAAYNSGPGTVDAAGGAPTYTHAYIERVLGNLESLGDLPFDVDVRLPSPITPVDGGSSPVATVDGTHTSAQTTAAAPAAPAPPVTGAIAERIMAAVEQLQNQPPPQRMIVEIPELDGARFLVALRNGSVVVTPRGAEAQNLASWLPAIEAALERHGLDTGRRDRRRDQDDPDDPSESVARRRREVIMEGADQ